MKKIILLSIILGMILGMRVNVFAKEKSAVELYKEDKDAFYRKYMCLDEEAEQKGYYSDAKVKKSTISGNSSSSSLNVYYSSEAKGYVYGVDELHIVGLPTDERGYTKAGDYGTIYKGVK